MWIGLKKELGYQRLPYKTFYNWFQHFLQFGETPCDTQRRIRLARGKRKQYPKATTFSAQEDCVLQDIYEEKPHLFLDEIQTAMRRKFGKLWHTSTLWRRMHALGYSLQKMVFRARQRSEADRQRFRRKLDVFLPDPRMAIWVDETQKSSNAARRLRGWGKRSNPPVVDTFFEEDFRKRYTMIGASNYKGFVESACKIVEREHDRNDRDPDRGTVDTEKFEKYVEFSLAPVLGSCAHREPNSVVFMDNAIIHVSEKVKRLIEEAGAILVYTAPYSPDKNPIEFNFSVYKAALKRHTLDGLGWELAHKRALKAVTPEKAVNFYKKAGAPLRGILGASTDDDAAVAVAAASAAIVAALGALDYL